MNNIIYLKTKYFQQCSVNFSMNIKSYLKYNNISLLWFFLDVWCDMHYCKYGLLVLLLLLFFRYYFRSFKLWNCDCGLNHFENEIKIGHVFTWGFTDVIWTASSLWGKKLQCCFQLHRGDLHISLRMILILDLWASREHFFSHVDVTGVRKRTTST